MFLEHQRGLSAACLTSLISKEVKIHSDPGILKNVRHNGIFSVKITFIYGLPNVAFNSSDHTAPMIR